MLQVLSLEWLAGDLEITGCGRTACEWREGAPWWNFFDRAIFFPVDSGLEYIATIWLRHHQLF